MRKGNNSLSYSADVALLFLFVFSIPFSFIPINSSKIAFLVLLFFSLLKNKSNFNLKSDFVFSVIFLFLMSVCSLVLTILHGAYDFSVSYSYFIFAFEAMVGAYLIYKVLIYRFDFHEVLNLFVAVCVVQSLVIIGMFAFESFRDIIFTFSESRQGLMERYGGFRGFGLAGSVTYDLSVFLSISLFFISYLVVEVKKNSYLYIIFWIIIVIAVLMTGRTGWLGIVCSLVFLIINLPFRSKALRALFFLITTILFSTLAFTLYTSLYSYGLYETITQGVVPYAFEMFINLFQSGSFSTSSTDHLATMYFVVSEGTLFFGDGYWDNPHGFGYYMATDAGYMRHVLYYGLGFSLFLYFFYLFGFYKIFKSLPLNRNNILLVGFLAIFFFVAHFKGDFLLGSSMNIKLFSILFVYSLWNKYGKNNLYRQYT